MRLPVLSLPPKGPSTVKFGSQGGFACLDLNLHSLTRHSVGARGCHFSVTPSLLEPVTEFLLFLPSGSSVRMAIRSRLTLIRLALIRNPWSYGEEVSRLLYRYLYLHLLFRPLQQRSSATFVAVGMLPYQCRFYRHSMSSAPCLCPIIIHAGPLD